MVKTIYFYTKRNSCDPIILDFFKKNSENYEIIDDPSSFKKEIGEIYRFYDNSLFGSLKTGFVELKNRVIINNSPIYFFMMYYDEDILSEYGIYHEFMTYIKLEPQTVYFESQGFRLIENIPDFEYIGIITPSLYRKTKLTIKQIIEKVNQEDLIPLYPGNQDLLTQAIESHGKNFEIIWIWLMKSLNIKIRKLKVFYSNLWVLKRSKFIEYINLARKAMDLLDNAPDNIKILLNSDAKYITGKLSAEALLKKTNYKYYTYYPFIMERLICNLY